MMIMIYKDWFGSVWFDGISIIVASLKPNTFYTYILNIWFLNIFCRKYFSTSLSSFFYTYFHQIKTIQSTINHFFAHSLMFLVLLCIMNNSIKTIICLLLNVKQFYFKQFSLACQESWLVGCILRHINPCRLFNAKPIFIQMNSSISNNSV